MHSTRSSRTRHDRAAQRRGGYVLVLVMLLFLVLLGFAGLALDTALVRTTGQELQAAADSAALAAAERIRDDDAASDWPLVRQAGVACAAANSAANDSVTIGDNAGNGAGGDIVLGIWDHTARTFTPDSEAPNAVRVTTRRTGSSPDGPLELLFGGAFGANTSDISRTAIATHSRGGGAANVIVLDPTIGKAFDMRGNTVLLSYNGGIQVNSNHGADALYLNGAPGDPRVRSASIRVVGTSRYPSGSLAPAPIDGSPVIPDPLADLPYPNAMAMTDRGGITGPGSYEPGYYPDGIDFNGGEALLAPGVYYIGAPTGVNLHGSALLRGDDVMIFLGVGAPFVIGGIDAGMVITAPSSGTYEGVSLFAHRDTDLVFDISGTGEFQLVGTMYMAGGKLEMDGTVDRQIGRIIVDTLQFRGNGTYQITGEGPPDTRPLTTYLVR